MFDSAMKSKLKNTFQCLLSSKIKFLKSKLLFFNYNIFYIHQVFLNNKT